MQKTRNRIRIGIDVGGTFTKAVAIDMEQGKVVGKTTVPTTHASAEGVSTGIVQALKSLMQTYAIESSEIELISHSTTQAVNALLEGDTSKVGIVGMGVGLEKSNVVRRTNLKDIKLGLNKYLKTVYCFLDTSKYLDAAEVDAAISDLKRENAEVIVATEAYGVDDPSNEIFVMQRCKDVPATGGHELTGIYGLEIRTLTAAINAGILPKAIATAKFVESAVRNENITSPVMIMKGDGGVTDITTFRNKPIVTVLSGPAASVAGALLHLRIIDGIFVEVGGTSTNVCIIKDGRPEIRYVTIMQHPTCIRSLDVRVAGVAGGSLVRWSGRKITDVGPRSAHIAGLPYSCFAAAEYLEGGQIITFSPKEGDPLDYIAIEANGKRYAITNTCAANALGIVPKGDYAEANGESARLALSILAARLGASMEDTARTILEISANKVMGIVKPMLREYKVKEDKVILVGGGGAASVLVPHIAKKLGHGYKLADYADVISSIGVAAAMIHEEKERTVSDPLPEDLSAIVEEVKEAALSRGALPESITIQSEYISDRSVLRATATGNVSLDTGTVNAKEIDEEEAHGLARELFGISEGVQRIFTMKNYHVFSCELNKKKLFMKSKKQPVLVLDRFGRVRLSVDNAAIINGAPDTVADQLETLLRKHKSDGNGLAPQVHILDGIKLVDFSSLTAADYVSKAIREELKKTTSNEVAAILRL